MSQYFWGCNKGVVSDREATRIRRALKRAGLHNAYFTREALPNGPHYWFSGPNRGEPFDRQLQAAAEAAVGPVKVRPHATR